MNVFADFHHASLLNSLIMLFEGRLGGNVYRPIGMEWAERGFWGVYDHPATQAQFLSLDQGYRPADGSPPLNLIKEVQDASFDQPQVYYCRDIESDRTNKAITFETFCDIDIDIIIASVPQHIEPFKRLIRLHKPNAKLIFQVGNSWTTEAFDAPNVMASAKVEGDVSNLNYVEYHQEFDLNVFRPNPLDYWWPEKEVNSFINVYQHFPDYPLFEEVERLMPDWKFNSFGGQCRDGSIPGSEKLAAKMREGMFGWHVKAGGDGFGHVLFNLAASGKPIITKKSYYAGTLGEKLMIDGETCINIDNMPANEIKAAIEWFAEPKNYRQMCENVYANFREQVDFDADFEKIKAFIERLR